MFFGKNWKSVFRCIGFPCWNGRYFDRTEESALFKKNLFVFFYEISINILPINGDIIMTNIEFFVFITIKSKRNFCFI